MHTEDSSWSTHPKENWLCMYLKVITPQTYLIPDHYARVKGRVQQLAMGLVLKILKGPVSCQTISKDYARPEPAPLISFGTNMRVNSFYYDQLCGGKSFREVRRLI